MNALLEERESGTQAKPEVNAANPALRSAEDSQRKMALMRLLGTAAPVVYIWSLPLLRMTGFAHECTNWPDCDGTGPSVSSFICTPQATGAMAATFFYPCLHMWLNAQQTPQCWAYLTLIGFQFWFGMFLVLPVEYVPDAHAFAVNNFCLCGLLHYGIVSKQCAARRLYRCGSMLALGVVSYMGVFVLVVISSLNKNVLFSVRWLFFIFEASGLSSMAVFPMLWYAEHPDMVDTGFFSADSFVSRSTAPSQPEQVAMAVVAQP